MSVNGTLTLTWIPPKAPPDINSSVLLSDVCRTQSFELNPICHFVWQKDSLKFSQYTLNHDLLFVNKDVFLDELLSSKLIEFSLAWWSKAQFFLEIIYIIIIT